MSKKSDKYKRKAFDREQIICVAESILGGAMDLLQGGLPDSIYWNERVNDPRGGLTAYEKGILEGAG